MFINETAHCYGEGCINYHKSILANMSVSTREIERAIDKMERDSESISQIMGEAKLSRLNVVYEKLYYSRNAEEWMAMFRFLGVGPMNGLTMEIVQAVSRKTSMMSEAKQSSEIL